MNVAYVECIGGVSGNMLLGALVDAGAELAEVERALRTLPVGGWTLEDRKMVKLGVAARFLDFNIPGDHFHPNMGDDDGRHEPHNHPDGSHETHSGRPHSHAERRLSDVLAILERSKLTASQKARAGKIYERLAAAEAQVHGTTLADVHFHEVGAVDAILDVAAACVALDLLCVEEVVCGPFPIGTGTIEMLHGRYPNPPPATWELLRGFPTYAAGIEGEMVTTTGAAILTSLAQPREGRPAMRVQRVGYGAGRSDFAIPNVTRVSIGRALEAGAAAGDTVAILEANVDDMQPQYYELAFERLFAAGALDVWLTPVLMKKSRPALCVAAIVPVALESECASVLLAQTSTLGVRVRHERRYLLERTIETVQTPLGTVRVKVAKLNGTTRRTLEYDDVSRIARERGLPMAEAARQLDAALPPL